MEKSAFGSSMSCSCQAANVCLLHTHTHFLTSQGRVQNECLLYKVDEDEWLVECCAQGQDTLIQHLNKYKLRSKVQIDPCEDFIVCWSGNMNNVQDERAFVAEDPRTSTLGQRILLPSSASIPENSEDEYQMLRLTEGVAEGCDEVPPADCLPLEYNLDYMKGVSFTKGCYLGQELTARAHFTGVVRKRILPVCFKDERVPLPRGSTVVVDGGRSVGRVVAKEGALGLGLIKYMTTDPVFAKDPVSGQLLEMSFTIPKWWPTNA